jgi:hypothetical protein
VTLIHADMTGVLDASWSTRRAGKVGRNPQPLEALERVAADLHVALCQWVELDDALDDALLDARLAGWSLARIAEAARLSVRDPRIRALKNPPRRNTP